MTASRSATTPATTRPRAPRTRRGRIEQLEAINARCLAHGIPRPVSFAYPGNVLDKDVLPILHGLGIKFARRGGAPEYPYDKGRGFAYEPGRDHPLLIPSAGDARPGWTLDDFKRAVSQARGGKIAVIQLHGVPDTAHSWVNTPTPLFESYVKYLADNGYRVIALRDLARYVDPTVVPSNPWGVIEDRKRQHVSGRGREVERARDDVQGGSGRFTDGVLPERHPLTRSTERATWGNIGSTSPSRAADSRSVPSGKTALLSRTRRLASRWVAIRAAIESVVTSQLAGSRSARGRRAPRETGAARGSPARGGPTRPGAPRGR